MLAWEGYDDPDIVRPFQEKTGITVNVKTASSNANQLDQTPRRRDSVRRRQSRYGLDGEVRTERPHHAPRPQPTTRTWRRCSSPSRTAWNARLDGQLYGVTTRWGINGIVHWRDKLSEADAADANVIWDPKFAEKHQHHRLGRTLPLAGRPVDGPGETGRGDAARRWTRSSSGSSLNSSRICAPCTTEVGACKTDLANQDAWVVWG